MYAVFRPPPEIVPHPSLPMRLSARLFALLPLLLFAAGPVTASVLPNPTVTSAATAYSAAFQASNLFDSAANEYASLNLGAGAAFSTTAGTWVQMDFGSPVTMDRFILVSRTNAADIIGTSRLILSNDPTFDSTDTIFSFNPSGFNGQGLVKSFTPTTARYARWEVGTSTGNSQNLGGYEMRFLDTPAGSLVAPATAYASATPYSTNYVAANAVNGDAGRGGPGIEYACLGLGTGMYVDFDLGSVVPVTGFDFFDRIPPVDRTTAFTMTFDDDSSTFASPVTTKNFSPGATGWGYTQTFAPVNARYIRLKATAVNALNNNSGIQEIIFYKEANLNAPLVANTGAATITSSSATVGGTITRVGADTPSVTLYYGTVNGGTTAANWQNSVALGGQTGAFTTELTGLLPNKTYFFTSFAQNTAGQAWAEPVLDFTTLVGPPVIVNTSATEINSTSARLGSDVTSTGGQAPAVIFYHGPSDGGTNPANWLHNVTTGPQTGPNSTVVAGLTPGAPYYYRAFAANQNSSAWAPSTATFTAATAVAPVVENRPATDINAFSAVLAGRVTATGFAAPSVTVFYGPADGGTNPTSWAYSADLGVQTGDFSRLVINLAANTTYYYRALATNTAGTSWAASSATFTSTTFTPVTVYLNEFAAATGQDDPRIYLDQDGSPEDWIEISNPNASAVNIGGYYLTDNATRPTKWRFPTPTIIPANGYLVVFASEKDRKVSGQQLHTNFKLSGSGEYLGFFQPDGVTAIKAFSPQFPAQTAYYSYGLTLPSTGGVYAPFGIPTPGAANTTTPGAPAGEVVFSIPSKTFVSTAPLSLSLSTASPTAQIHYTTNRTEPTAASTLYTAAIPVTTTTMVRARAFETAPGFAPGPVHSESYFLLGAAAATFNSNLPVVVLNGYGTGRPDADTAMSWTLFEPGTPGGHTVLTTPPTLATRGRMVVRGSSSAGWPKYSLSIEAWNEVNEDKDVSPLGLPPEGDWVLQSNYQYDLGMMRNPVAYEISNRMGRWAAHSRFVEVFVNTNDGTVDYPGDYMGVYSLMEKPERGADRIPVERLTPADLTAPNVTGGYIVKIDRLDPGTTGWTTSRNFPLTEPFGTEVRLGHFYPEENPSPAPAIPTAQRDYLRKYIQDFEDAVVTPTRVNPATGLSYTDYIDRDSWVDHALVNILTKNPDCFRLSTYMHKPRNGKLIAGPVWDFDRTMNSTDGRDASPIGWSANQPATDIMTWGWWKYLWADPDFMQRFTDRWAELRGDILKDAKLTGIIDQMGAEISEAAVRNYAKWPAVPLRDGPDAGATATYSDEVDILRLWMTQRTAWIDSQFVPRPVLTPSGGLGNPAVTATQGTIYYTLDGSDPRAPGGGIKAGALTTASGSTLTISGSAQVTARAKNGALWSAPATGFFFTQPAAAAGNLVISELHYHPADPTPDEFTAGFTDADDFEFIELQNISGGIVDLSGVKFTAGVDFAFPLGMQLTAGQRVLVVSNQAAFNARYPAVPTARVAGQYLNDRLNNGGEKITLTAASGAVILDFTYGTAAPWPLTPDGKGPSLVLIAPGTNPNPALPGNWRPSTSAAGNPNAGDSVPFTGSALADSDNDGYTDLLEYALGGNPAPVPALTPEGLTFTINRAPGADDAEIGGEASAGLSGWVPADLIGSTATSLTFRVPAALATGTRVFIRATARLR